MKGIVEEIRASIKEAEEAEFKANVERFVKNKLQRLDTIRKNIANFQDEETKILESLDKIENENYEEIKKKVELVIGTDWVNSFQFVPTKNSIYDKINSHNTKI